MPIKFYNYRFNLLKRFSVGRVIKQTLQVPIYRNCICQPLIRKDIGEGFIGGLYTVDDEYIASSGVVTHGRDYLGEGEKAPSPVDVIDGKSLYIGLCHVHYGHFIIETLSRLWCHEEHPLQNFDNIIILPVNGVLKSFVVDLFEYLGIKEKIRLITSPVTIEKAYVPDVSVKYPFDLYQQLNQLYSLFSTLDTDVSEQPLFISRSLLIPGQERIIIGEQYIETILEKNGVKIFHPQNHSILEQISIFRRHRTIIGFAGSALHTIILSGGRKRIFSYSSRTIPSIFPLIDKVLRNKATYINSKETYEEGEYDVSVSFKPQMIDPRPIILKLFKEKVIKHYNLDEYNNDKHDKKILRQYNTEVLMRFIHELHGKNKKGECRNIILNFIDRYEIDQMVLNKSLAHNTYLKGYFP